MCFLNVPVWVYIWLSFYMWSICFLVPKCYVCLFLLVRVCVPFLSIYVYAIVTSINRFGFVSVLVCTYLSVHKCFSLANALIPVSLYVYLTAWLHACQYLSLYIYICLYILVCTCMCVCLDVYVCLCLSVKVSFCLFSMCV